MDVAKNQLDPSSAHRLQMRNLLVRQPDRKTVRVCADDGSREGFPIGWAELAPSHGRPAWHTVYRSVPGDDSSYWRGGIARRAGYQPMEYGGSDEIRLAIDEILTLARWGDVLADREIRSGRTGTYTAVMDPAQAEWLAGLDEPKGITHLGGGRVRLTNVVVALFRGSPDPHPHVDANDLFHLDPLDAPIQLIRER
ncbi:hypothetical protein CU254_03675 [Amycolatopsis sp. AA4]|uniref:hypothetical protein n=1 Tax=Actinomycetes TaxID=1760 RepID=UPI0001B55F84|nr:MULTISPECIES: hypothetical protein [Actinomycetes]ATY09663.1 hypothetical protein CU254_03675 [Amycolatopsis sp. AA4]EFL05043.1 predicted protein [Streptomyces sp. AA4]